MLSQEFNLQRTAGDSIDQAIQILIRQLVDANEVPVPDSATVTMYLQTDPVLSVPSTNQGIENGIWYFDGDVLSGVAAGLYEYEIQVVQQGDDWTPIRGQIEFIEEIEGT